ATAGHGPAQRPAFAAAVSYPICTRSNQRRFDRNRRSRSAQPGPRRLSAAQWRKRPRLRKIAIYSSELSPYVEAEEFGFVVLLCEYGFGKIKAQRPKRRGPVDADADRQTRSWRIADEQFLETR